MENQEFTPFSEEWQKEICKMPKTQIAALAAKFGATLKASEQNPLDVPIREASPEYLVRQIAEKLKDLIPNIETISIQHRITSWAYDINLHINLIRESAYSISTYENPTVKDYLDKVFEKINTESEKKSNRVCRIGEYQRYESPINEMDDLPF